MTRSRKAMEERAELARYRDTDKGVRWSVDLTEAQADAIVERAERRQVEPTALLRDSALILLGCSDLVIRDETSARVPRRPGLPSELSCVVVREENANRFVVSRGVGTREVRVPGSWVDRMTAVAVGVQALDNVRWARGIDPLGDEIPVRFPVRFQKAWDVTETMVRRSELPPPEAGTTARDRRAARRHPVVEKRRG